MNHRDKKSIKHGYADGKQGEFLITVTSKTIIPENEYVVHFDLSANRKKTDSREMLDSGP